MVTELRTEAANLRTENGSLLDRARGEWLGGTRVVYCCDFLLLPIASYCSVRISCSCLDAPHTRSSRLPPSPAVAYCLPLSTTRLSLLSNPNSQDHQFLNHDGCGGTELANLARMDHAFQVAAALQSPLLVGRPLRQRTWPRVLLIRRGPGHKRSLHDFGAFQRYFEVGNREPI